MRRAVLVAGVLLASALPAPAPAQDEAGIVYSAYRYGGRGAGSVIFTIVPGGEPVRLTGSRSFNLEPEWSPDRAQIAYVHHARPRNPDIWVMDADGSGKVRLTSGRPDDVYPRWSPDGSHIAWVKDRRRGSERIYVMHPDGADKIAVSPERHRASQPAWSPDGTSIAYVHHPRCSDCPGDGEIFVVDGHSAGPAERLTDNDLHDVNPVWSPDGSRIAFARGRDDGADLYTMAADGSDVRQLTSVDGYALLPRWSPDGTEIAFTVIVDVENFHTRLGVVDVETGETRLLTDVEAGGILPDWSPDGGRIAFVGFHSGGHNLGVIGRDGTGLAQLTDSRLDEAWLDW
ncbi:MAG TPA: hypothetical protein VHN37_05125 [Actinomycetota bacterium]|nr:hypothetical protein [Actinomycetota bacterium]